MAKFAYQAITKSGKTISGTTEAESLDMANYVLSEKGLIPSKVTLAAKKGLGFSMEGLLERLTPVKTQDLILFTKQLRTMIKAGVPLLTLFRVLEDQTENLKLKKIVERMNNSEPRLGDRYCRSAGTQALIAHILHDQETLSSLPHSNRNADIHPHQTRIEGHLPARAISHPSDEQFH